MGQTGSSCSVDCNCGLLGLLTTTSMTSAGIYLPCKLSSNIKVPGIFMEFLTFLSFGGQSSSLRTLENWLRHLGKFIINLGQHLIWSWNSRAVLLVQSKDPVFCLQQCPYVMQREEWKNHEIFSLNILPPSKCFHSGTSYVGCSL